MRVATWLAAHPASRDSTASKSRAIFPLQTLLADGALRAHLLELAKAFGSAIRLPLVLVLPSPRAWIGLAYRQAHDAQTEVGDDGIDSASVYAADLLRSFGDGGVDSVLLEEAAGDGPIEAGPIALYRPVLNVAAHYQWGLGLRTQDTNVPTPAMAAMDFGFAISTSMADGARHAVATDPGFWSAVTPSPIAAGGFLYAEIPAGAMPERVLERLSVLKDAFSPH